MIENKKLVTYFINIILVICVFLIMFAFTIATISLFMGNDVLKSKFIEIKVKDIIKTEDAYIIFDTNNNMYAYSKLMPEISIGKNYTIRYDYTISEFYNFYRVDDKMVEV